MTDTKEHIHYLIRQGKESYNLGKYDEVVSFLEEIVDRSCELEEAHIYLSLSYLRLLEQGDTFLRIRLLPKLDKLITKTRHKFPESIQIHKVMALRYLYIPRLYGGNIAKAIKEFECCIELGLCDFDIYFNYGYAQLQIGEYCKAVYFFKKANGLKNIDEDILMEVEKLCHENPRK